MLFLFFVLILRGQAGTNKSLYEVLVINEINVIASMQIFPYYS